MVREDGRGVAGGVRIKIGPGQETSGDTREIRGPSTGGAWARIAPCARLVWGMWDIIARAYMSG